jgi:hypothetical protein
MSCWMRRTAPLLFLVPVLGAAQQPRSVLIPGVPFVPWREAAKVEPYWGQRGPDNPSIRASRAMVRAYWTIGQDERAPASVLLGCCQNAGDFRRDSATSFADLKPLLASGRPVILDLALTADGHQLTIPFFVARGLHKPPRPDWPEGVSSRMLGPVMPLWAADSFRTAEYLFGTPVMDATDVAERVVIGYDDTRGVVIVHDPSFGPAVEIPLSDFEPMWAATNRLYLTLEVPDAENVIRHRAGAPPYRDRTVEERAAQLWVQGAMRAALAMAPAAEQDLRAALALPGLGSGYEHLVQLDLGAALIAQQRYGEAIAALRRSVELVPENPRGWELLADAATAAGQEDLARDATKKMKKSRQVRDMAAFCRRLTEAIPADVWVFYFAEHRGWGVNPRPCE